MLESCITNQAKAIYCQDSSLLNQDFAFLSWKNSSIDAQTSSQSSTSLHHQPTQAVPTLQSASNAQTQGYRQDLAIRKEILTLLLPSPPDCSLLSRRGVAGERSLAPAADRPSHPQSIQGALTPLSCPE